MKFFTSLHLLFVGASLIFSQTLAAQNYVISGRVIDAADSLPTAFANVIVYNTADSAAAGFTATDADGEFGVTLKSAGSYYLSVSYLGYKTLKTGVIALTDAQPEKRLPTLHLEQDEQRLKEVVVTGRKRQVVYKLDRQVIEAAEYLSAAGGTAVDILQQTPSVRVDAEGNVSFRGSTAFKVYIDGKPGALDGTAALEQIAAGQIDNIEIMTTPSAKNEADGSAGIININTKKLKTDGASGVVNLMGSSVKSRSLDFLLARRNRDFLWQLSGEASKRYVISDYDQLKKIYTPELLTTDYSVGDRVRHTSLYKLRSDFDWYRERTVWSAAASVGYRDRWRGGELHYDDVYETPDGSEKWTAEYKGKDFVHLYEYQLRGDAGVEHSFAGKKGHKLSASLYVEYEGDAMENFQTDLWDMQGVQAQGHRAWEYEYRLEGEARADYVYPFDNETGKFEAGYKLTTYTEDGDYTIDMYSPETQQFERRDDLYNRYIFRRDIHALYAMLSDTYRRFGYQAGLRGEYQYRRLDNNLKWAENRIHRFDLFPSVHLSYQLSEASQLRASYARRITQPELFWVEPYVVYVDYYTAQQGNPRVKPEFTNSIEAGFNTSRGNNSFAATLFYRARRDKVERLRIPYKESMTLDSIANVGNDYSTGLELLATWQILRFWNLDANASFYHYRIKNRFKVDDDETSWNRQFALNNNFEITTSTRLRAEAYYIGPMVSTQGRVDGYFYFNLALRQQFFDRKLTCGITAQDLFSTAKYINRRLYETTNASASQYLDSYSRIYPRSPLLTLTLSYTFNNFRRADKAVDVDLFEGTNR